MFIYALGILEKNGKIVLLLRQNVKFFSGYYSLVGGKVEENESPSQALIRECAEEIGIVISNDNLEFAHCLSFKNETDKDHLAFVFKIDNCDDPITNKEPEKCSELAWFSVENLPENIIPRHQLMIEKVAECIPYYETGW